MGIPVEIVRDGVDWAVVAAWVQGIGSVLAIIAAIVISDQERRNGQRDRKAAEAAFALLAVGLAKQAVELARDAQAGLAARKVRISADNVGTVLDTLDRLPMEKMPSAEFALAYVNVRRALYFYGQSYEGAVMFLGSGGDMDESGSLNTNLFNMAESVKLQFERLETEARAVGVKLVARPDNDTDRAIKALGVSGAREL